MSAPSVLSRLFARPGAVPALILIASLAAGTGASEVFRLVMEADHRAAFDIQAQSQTAHLHARTLSGKAMGTIAFAGAADPALRAAATDPNPARWGQGDPAARTLEIIGRIIGGDGAFVVNRSGIITASWDTQGRTRIGNDISFRPYVQNALHGTESVYPAVGSSTGDRALYLAAPIQSGRGGALGAVVGRINMTMIDQSLRDWSGHAVLLSPQGVVFSSSRRDWLLSLVGEASPERIRAIAALKQFGGAFDGPHRIKTLPFDPDATTTRIEGERYMTTRLPLKWNDAQGEWSLVLLKDLAPATPLAPRLAVGALAALGVIFPGLLAARGGRDRIRRREEEEARQREARIRTAEAERKSRQSDLVTRLQLAHDVTDLAHAFFFELARDLPLHQASLYVIDDADGTGLALAGLYGGTEAPARIRVGEGLVGECARMRQTLCFAAPPAGFWRICSGLGEAQPRALLLMPVIRTQTVLGVVELASLNPDFDENRAAIEALLPILAVNIEILMAARRARDTLAEAHRQAEALRHQQDVSQQTEDWFRTILDGMPIGLLVVDDAGRITLSNREIERMTGYSLQDLLGMDIERLMPESVRSRHVAWRRALAMREDQVVMMGSERPALALLTRDGSERRVEISLARTPALGSQPPCVCAMIRAV